MRRELVDWSWTYCMQNIGKPNWAWVWVRILKPHLKTNLLNKRSWLRIPNLWFTSPVVVKLCCLFLRVQFVSLVLAKTINQIFHRFSFSETFTKGSKILNLEVTTLLWQQPLFHITEFPASSVVLVDHPGTNPSKIRIGIRRSSPASRWKLQNFYLQLSCSIDWFVSFSYTE